MRFLTFLPCLLALGTQALVEPDVNSKIVSEALKAMDLSPEGFAVQEDVPATTLLTVAGSAPTKHAVIAAAAAAAADPAYWMKDIPKQGIAAFNSNPGSYKVWRNVKDYGAKGKPIILEPEDLNQLTVL